MDTYHNYEDRGPGWNLEMRPLSYELLQADCVTWLDPRFGPGGSLSPNADGGRPGNSLAGTMYMVNDGATTAITVPAADGKMRFWRNTSIATLAAGTTATLANSTLGYEWDGDADNGFRPAGLFRMSTTTVNSTRRRLEPYSRTMAV